MAYKSNKPSISETMAAAAARMEAEQQAHADARMAEYHQYVLQKDDDAKWADVETDSEQRLVRAGVQPEEISMMENPELAEVRGEDTALVAKGSNQYPGEKPKAPPAGPALG